MKYETSLYYLSEEGAAEELKARTNLAMDEIEAIVGRFRSNSFRAGKLRGQVLEDSEGRLRIVHHFTKKELWSE